MTWSSRHTPSYHLYNCYFAKKNIGQKGSSTNKILYLIFFLLKGQPMPQVSWWRDSHLIDSSFEKTFGRTVQNTLSVPQVSREDLGAMLTCQASNNNISAPASSRVTIDLKCKYNNIHNLQIVL